VLFDPQTLRDIGGTPGPLPSEMNRCDERDLTFASSDHGGRSRIWETLSCPQHGLRASLQSRRVPWLIVNKYLRQQAPTDTEAGTGSHEGPSPRRTLSLSGRKPRIGRRSPRALIRLDQGSRRGFGAWFVLRSSRNQGSPSSGDSRWPHAHRLPRFEP
jgi:hypothetical protein